MNEINILTDLESPQHKGTKICISVDNNEAHLLYKFLIGLDGTWNMLRDFSKEPRVYWLPEKDGKYIIMVLAKEENTKKSHNFISKVDFTIGEETDGLIKEAQVSKSTGVVGEKIIVTVTGNSDNLLYRYWIKEGSKCTLLRDYGKDNVLSYVPSSEGEKEITIECKDKASEKEFDDFSTVAFNICPMEKTQIINFKCLSDEVLVNRELTFEVDVKAPEGRITLYKFIHLDEMGNGTVVQDFSTRRMVSFKEAKAGTQRLICFIRDMYSKEAYDDRALINYKVEPYKPIKIGSFTTDLSSPQIVNSAINLKAIVTGGNNLKYKFVIDGNESISSEYSSHNNFIWKPERCGDYKLTLMVKDESYKGQYEQKRELDFSIEEDFVNKVFIEEVLMDKKGQVLLGQAINVKVIASSNGIDSEIVRDKVEDDLLYEFTVFKDDTVVERLEYGENNWVDFQPEAVGKYKMEVMVKHRLSKRLYDAHSIVYIDCRRYIPSKIDYVLLPQKSYNLVKDIISLEVVCENNLDTKVKYRILINDRFVEETDYCDDKRIDITPRCSGKYNIQIMCKNIKSTNEFDDKREMIINVIDAMPITNCRIALDKDDFMVNEPVTFTAQCMGGRDVIYEFYLMERGEWKVIQKYSKKKYYTFIPFNKGYYKILALCKSSSNRKKVAYEDYSMIEIEVTKGGESNEFN